MEEVAPALEDCLKLLRGERDEQQLAGLFLATKLFRGDDIASVLRIYDAVGARFLNRLLMTGMGKGNAGVKGCDDREEYLRLSVTVLAAFCRVPEIASSKYMVMNVPLILEIISKSSEPSILEESCEYLFLVGSASEDGFTKLYESGVVNVLASHISTLLHGSQLMPLAFKLLQLILSNLPSDTICFKYPSEISNVVAALARQFALLHSALKFDALHLLTAILSSRSIEVLHDALRSISDKVWATYMHGGIMAILQNRVASTEKLQALHLADSMMSILGENWLLDHSNLPGVQRPIPVDKCLLLVLETSRIEVAVLLNELAYLKYEASKSFSSTAETILLKQRNLALSFSLIEKIIKLVSNVCGSRGCLISDNHLMKVIDGLNETIGLVLDFLNDAKDHGQRKGDDLLASVRIFGSYLAEAPSACKEKTRDLLEYILSIEAPSTQSALCFQCCAK